MFLRFAIAVCMLWCAIELLEVLLFDSYISSRTFSILFLFRMDSIEIFHACVSVCAVSRSHQSTVANSKEIEYNVFFWLQAECYLLLLYIIQMACFSEGRNSSQFFIAWKAGYNHPPPLDS